jgi:hypothetical protein
MENTNTRERITQDHPKYAQIRSYVNQRFNQDFNFIQSSNVETIMECWMDGIQIPNVDEDNFEELATYYGIDFTKNEDGEIENFEELRENLQEILHNESGDIMWATYFEPKDNHLADLLMDHMEELFHMGITIIDLRDFDEAEHYQTGLFLSVRGCGYDFYLDHWIPLYVNMLGWVNPDDLEG